MRLNVLSARRAMIHEPSSNTPVAFTMLAMASTGTAKHQHVADLGKPERKRVSRISARSHVSSVLSLLRLAEVVPRLQQEPRHRSAILM
jgi:hypothetical protein